jgi:hypothetical protein
MTDRRNVGGSAILALALLLAPHMTDARAVNMVESKPQAETTIDGDHAEYVVRFDGPVNHYASRLEIVQDGRVVRQDGRVVRTLRGDGACRDGTTVMRLGRRNNIAGKAQGTRLAAVPELQRVSPE